MGFCGVFNKKNGDFDVKLDIVRHLTKKNDNIDDITRHFISKPAISISKTTIFISNSVILISKSTIFIVKKRHKRSSGCSHGR
jgi:hypothetical protein